MTYGRTTKPVSKVFAQLCGHALGDTSMGAWPGAGWHARARAVLAPSWPHIWSTLKENDHRALQTRMNMSFDI